jgi:hypothetical protein
LLFKKKVSNGSATDASGDIMARKTLYIGNRLPRDAVELRLQPRELAKEALTYEKEGLHSPETAVFPGWMSWAGLATPNPFISLKL